MPNTNIRYKLFAILFLIINMFVFTSVFSLLFRLRLWIFSIEGLILFVGAIITIFIIELFIVKKISPTLFETIRLFFYDEEESIAKLETEKFLIELRNNIIHKNNENVGNKKVPEVETDILELMLANMGEIKDYYALSKIQAKNSFRLAVSMCVIGFMLIVSSIVFLFLFKESIEIALIPAISGAIVEVIAGTTLFVYKKSLSQLNHYYASLHSNERYLSLVHLASKISENKRDEIYAEIIKTELNNCKITN